jgi:hypothetical protein
MTSKEGASVPTNRIRVVGWRVQPILMADDGEHLTPVQVTATEIPASGWAAFKDGGDEAALDQLRAQAGVTPDR